MAQLHDFEFQLGKNSALKGRGWRGLLALALLLATCAVVVNGAGMLWPIDYAIRYFGALLLGNSH